jgi:hypothetical protein
LLDRRHRRGARRRRRSAAAVPVTVSDPCQGLEVRSPNTLGRGRGPVQVLVVNSAVPNRLGGTTVIAEQGGTVLALPYVGSSAIRNEFSRGIAANPALRGAWTQAFSNGSDATRVFTPAIEPAADVDAAPRPAVDGSTRAAARNRMGTAQRSSGPRLD